MGIVKHFKKKWKTYSTKEKVIRIVILILFLILQTTNYFYVADVWWEFLMVGFTTGIFIWEIMMKSPKKRYERIKLKYKIKKLSDLSKEEASEGKFDLDITFQKWYDDFDYKIIMNDILNNINKKEYRSYIRFSGDDLFIYKLKLTPQEKKERLQQERKQKLDKLNE